MSSPRLVITGGRFIDPANNIDKEESVYIAKGQIVSVGRAPEGFHADREIKVPGHVVCPGLIDLWARVREPGLEHKATIASEVTAAVSAGITTLCCPPDTLPVIDTPAVAELIKDRADRIGKCRILPIGALTRNLNGEELSEMRALKSAGCIGVTNALSPVFNSLILRRAMEYATSFDMLVIVRPEDHWLRDQGVVHEGTVATRLGLPGIPEAAETVAVAQVLALVEQTGARVHFAQLSCGRAVEMIANAQQRDLQVSADVSAHQLHLTELDLTDYDATFRVLPPLRSSNDRIRLCKGIADGTIAAICSDHQPHEEGAKLNAFESAEAGMSTLETLLPLTLRLVDSGCVSMSHAIAGLTSRPAEILGLEIGQLAPGTVADLCIFDPQHSWIPSPDNWQSRGLNTPFFGQKMQGRVTHTLVAGRIVYELSN